MTKSTSITDIPFIGYADRLSVRPNETIHFKVSSQLQEPFQAHLTRSICADPNPQGVGILEQPVGSVLDGQTFPSRIQPFFPGSYAKTNQPVALDTTDGFSLSVKIFPTLSKETPQAIVCMGRMSLWIDAIGIPVFTFNETVLRASDKLTLFQWHQVEAGYDSKYKALYLRFCILRMAECSWHRVSVDYQENATTTTEATVVLAARIDKGQMIDHFNGKIEAPEIHSVKTGLVAKWDFSQEVSSVCIRDTGRNHYHGQLFNLPTRAVTGSCWDGSEMSWRHAPEHYAAIHFHEDDLYDLGWENDFSYTIPEDLPSGIYVMRLSCGNEQDAIPFFVCPPRFRHRTRLCLLVSTFTYVIYGNHARPDYDSSWQERIQAWNAYPYNAAEYRQYGLSTYNMHSDGSGICYASHKRPLFNIRPGYLTFGATNGSCSGLRHFQADSHLVAWLHAKNIPYDVITDQELHNEGASALEGYQAVCTGSHPEYHTEQSLNAIERYCANGGNFMYLGGNGFYWKIVEHSDEKGCLEIRRAEDGIRAWAANPGEYYHAFDGSYGGLWRRNNRPPQRIAGIGFSAQGNFIGTFYRRQCYDRKYDWIFEGIDDAIIGNFGFSGNGAAGFELDRIDYKLGTPENTVVLARSEVHNEDYIVVPEELLTHLTNIPGEPAEQLIRADMVYIETPSGGSIFSTGSITFCGSLPWNNFDNSVSRLLLNVVLKNIG